MTSRANAVVQVGVLVLLALVGPALLTWGAVDVARHDRLVSDGVRAEGTVVDFADAHKASERSVEVDFVAADGRTHRARGLAGADQHPEVGTTVPVAYDRDDPDHNAVVGYDPSGSSLLGMGTILTLLVAGLGLLLTVGRIRRRRRATADAA